MDGGPHSGDQAKTDAGGFASIAWLVAGALVFYREPEARLLSWQAPVFFVVGMFLAAGVFGGLLYLAGRGIALALVALRVAPSPGRMAAAKRVGYVLYAATAVAIYYAARAVVRAMY